VASKTTASSTINYIKPLVEAIAILLRFGNKYAEFQKRMMALALEVVESFTNKIGCDTTIITTTQADVKEHSNGPTLHTTDTFADFFDEKDYTSSTKMSSRVVSSTTVANIVECTKPLPKTLSEAISALQRIGNKYTDWQKRVIDVAREAVQSLTTKTAYDATIITTTQAEVKEHPNDITLHTTDSPADFSGKEDYTSSTQINSRVASSTTVSSVVECIKPLPMKLSEAIDVLQRFGIKYTDWQERVIALAQEAVQSDTTKTVSDTTVTTEATTTTNGCAKRITPLRRTTRLRRMPYVTDTYVNHMQPNLVDGKIWYVVKYKNK